MMLLLKRRPLPRFLLFATYDLLVKQHMAYRLSDEEARQCVAMCIGWGSSDFGEWMSSHTDMWRAIKNYCMPHKNYELEKREFGGSKYRVPLPMNIGRMRGYMSLVGSPTKVDALIIEVLDLLAEQFYDTV
jgi:hypothetical protein